jgi:prophage regulatory protein
MVTWWGVFQREAAMSKLTLSPDSIRGSALPDIVRMPTVMKFTGLGRSTIYRLIADKRFPGQVRLATRAVGWRRADLERWSESRPAVE